MKQNNNNIYIHEHLANSIKMHSRRNRIVGGFASTYMQKISVPITTKIVRSIRGGQFY